MKVRLFKDCREELPKGIRLMGLDFGKKTIGIAVSDGAQSIATPVTTIKRSKFAKDADALLVLIKEYEIGGLIVGWPLNMDGSIGPRCDATHSFVDELNKIEAFSQLNLFIAFHDERLSTRSVDNFVDSRVDMKRSSKIKAKDSGLKDALAAQIILQSALDGF